MIRYYAVYDKRLKLCNIPFSANSDEEAKQLVYSVLVESGKDSLLFKLREHLELYYVGSFDCSNMCFCDSGMVAPLFLVKFSDIPGFESDVGGGDSEKIS